MDSIEQRLAALESWKADRERQQITYPLDQESIEALNRYFMRIFASYDITYGGAAGYFFRQYFGSQDNETFQIQGVTDSTYSVDPSTDYLTILTGYTRFFDNDPVTVGTTDTPPAPLVSGTTYYVRDSADTTFKLAATAGGVAINITDGGAGLQVIAKA